MALILRAGQVLNFKNTNLFGRTISMGLGNYYNHSAWIRKVQGDNIYIQEAKGLKEKKVVTNLYKREYLEKVFNENRLHIMNFNINDLPRFEAYCTKMEGIPYDYYSIWNLFTIRVRVLFGIDVEKYMRKKPSKNKNLYSDKMLDCSELIARGINELRCIDVLKLTNKPKYDLVTPQDISNMYVRLNTHQTK